LGAASAEIEKVTRARNANVVRMRGMAGIL